MGGVEVTDMADVEDVKAAIGQNNEVSGAAPLRNALLQFVARNDFEMGLYAQSTPNVKLSQTLSAAQSSRAMRGAVSSAFSNSC